MRDKFTTPLPLFTAAFVVGCCLGMEIDIAIWTSLVIFLICGVFAFFKGWSVAILILSFALGTMRAGEEVGMTQLEISTFANEKVATHAQHRVERLMLSPRSETLLKAMLLGDRSTITPEQRRGYCLSGASHILAVSGLHLSVVFLLLNILLRPMVLLPRGNILKSIFVIIAVWSYACVVGLTPSVVRGAIMFSVLQLSWIAGRAYSGMSALSFAVLLIALLSPKLLYSISFQLSAISILAIYAIALPLRRWIGQRGFMISTLCVSLSCSLAVLPLVSHLFGYIPILGVLFAPIFISTATLIILCGAIWMILPFATFDPVLRLFVESAAMIQDSLVQWLSSIEWSYIEWRATEFQMWNIYIIYILLFMIVGTALHGRRPAPRSILSLQSQP